jgi:hypothetical protein
LENILNVKKRVNKDEMTEDHVLLFFTYIFELGYSIKTGEYKIPNNEIKEEFKTNIIEFHFSLYKLSYEDLNDAVESLNDLISDTIEIDSTNLERCLIKFLKPIEINNFNMYDSGVHGNEDIFHSIFNIISIKSIANKIGSEVSYQKLARSDIVLFNQSNGLGIIIEMKYDNSVEEALKQTEKYSYLFLKHDDIKIVKRIAISISTKKDVKIKIVKENVFINKNEIIVTKIVSN